VFNIKLEEYKYF